MSGHFETFGIKVLFLILSTAQKFKETFEFILKMTLEQNAIFQNFKQNRVHSFTTDAKFFEKLTFLTS